ncbi:hypothetical protein CgunFtcFv8_004588 [Champsocephalus gunnari]|uniref:Uncharacterized protein n=1 Tax=Champsocephalus gunnari TaxID=52237 RepID=A0AAN8I8J1_CHAGU|nr:hypothetical protein CgunFtcFv8_004588 [Champsocephalus gunnari]
MFLVHRVWLASDSLDLCGPERRSGLGGEGGQSADQVRAPSARGGKGFTSAAVVFDGCPSWVMPWDLRASRQLELETLSLFCPPCGAALIQVPGTSGCTVKRGNHEPAGCTTADQLDHQETVPRSLPAICTPAQGNGTRGKGEWE